MRLQADLSIQFHGLALLSEFKTSQDGLTTFIIINNASSVSAQEALKVTLNSWQQHNQRHGKKEWL